MTARAQIPAPPVTSRVWPVTWRSLVASYGPDQPRNYRKTPGCHSELVYYVSRRCLVSESPIDGNRPDEILKQVQDDTFLYLFSYFLKAVRERLTE